ncbi:MAG TPA: NUDIX domain-containing protein [Candidatus Saccharimonadales bacterium]|nr:NUDIX domain-containing protein [Candidatus Saccharimonadales bacterium]
MTKSERPKVVLVNRCLVKKDGSDKLLLIRRSKDDSHNSGMWEFPGGKLDIGQDQLCARA